MEQRLTDSEQRFAQRAVKRRRLFLYLAAAGLAIAGGLAIYYGYRRLTDPSFPVGPRGVIVLLILLNSRQNLRQYRYAGLLASLMSGAGAAGAAGGAGLAGGGEGGSPATVRA